MGTSTMLRTTAVLALAGSAAAFSPMMSMDMGRRDVLRTGAAAAIAAPLLRPSEASADINVSDAGGWSGPNYGCKHGTAPLITIFDHRGCSRGGAEFSGKTTGDKNDEMMVKVGVGKVQLWDAEAFLAENFNGLSASRK